MSRILRRRSSLFDAMSKAPQAQQPVPRSPWRFPWRKEVAPGSPPLSVAQPLTEEEVAAELAQQRAEQEQRERERLAKMEEAAARKARKEAERAARAARKAEARARVQAESDQVRGRSPIQVAGGRVTFSMSILSFSLSAAAVFALVVGAYSVGQRRGSGDRPTTVAALNASSGTSSSLAAKDAPGKATPQPTPRTRDENIERLISKPVIPVAAAAAANRPDRVHSPPPAATLTPEQLNYLQIDSFLINRENTDARARADLVEVQKFLAARGIATKARRYNNGYVLYAEQGFPPGREASSEREAFRRKIEALGREYRKAGGRYEFKDCAFVSYARTVAGQAL